MRRGKIFFAAANESAPWGASEELWSRSAMAIAATGDVDVTVSVRRWDDESSRLQALERSGCDLIRRREPETDAGRPMWDLPTSEVRDRTLERVHPDLVVVSQGDNIEGLGWMEEAARLQVPFVVMVMSSNDYQWPRDPVAERLRAAYQAAQQVWFICQHNWDLTELQIGARLSNAIIVPIYLKVPFDTPPTWPSGSPLSGAFVARFDPESKGHDLLFRVLTEERWRSRDFEVDLFGTGYHAGVVEKMVEFLNLSAVAVRGYVTDVPSIWRSHHALILPSRVEGQPAVIIEAMLSARPSIVVASGGNAELLEEGVTAFIAEAPTVDAVGNALERAWEARAQWREMGLQARSIARKVADPQPIQTSVRRLRAML